MERSRAGARCGTNGPGNAKKSAPCLLGGSGRAPTSTGTSHGTRRALRPHGEILEPLAVGYRRECGCARRRAEEVPGNAKKSAPCLLGGSGRAPTSTSPSFRPGPALQRREKKSDLASADQAERVPGRVEVDPEPSVRRR